MLLFGCSLHLVDYGSQLARAIQGWHLHSQTQTTTMHKFVILYACAAACMQVLLRDGPHKGAEVDFEYEDICKYSK